MATTTGESGWKRFLTGMVEVAGETLQFHQRYVAADDVTARINIERYVPDLSEGDWTTIQRALESVARDPDPAVRERINARLLYALQVRRATR